MSKENRYLDRDLLKGEHRECLRGSPDEIPSHTRTGIANLTDTTRANMIAFKGNGPKKGYSDEKENK